jgi:predicted ATP-grasp superfamily ATP-dependent carboligase
VHASVSLLSNGQEALALSLNKQKMQVGASFTYCGGRIPLQHPQAQRAISLARQAVSLIPGLRGYVGVDLIMTADECYVLEINPRLTTSYVGLRQIVDLNLAASIWDCCLAGRLPQAPKVTGSVSFRKDGTHG